MKIKKFFAFLFAITVCMCSTLLVHAAEYHITAFFIGEASSGKTQICNRILGGDYNEGIPITKKVTEHAPIDIDIKNYKYKLHLFDSPGAIEMRQAVVEKLGNNSIDNCNRFVGYVFIVYDLAQKYDETNIIRLEKLYDQVSDVASGATIAFVGSKIDKKLESPDYEKNLKELYKFIGPMKSVQLMLTSAKTNKGISEVLSFIRSTCVKRGLYRKEGCTIL